MYYVWCEKRSEKDLLVSENAVHIPEIDNFNEQARGMNCVHRRILRVAITCTNYR